MIQRIQSLYLLLVAILNGLLFVLPLNDMLSGGHIIRISVTGIFELIDDKTILIADLFPLLVINSISIVLAFAAIFLYKNRKAQMRLTIYNSLINVSITFLALFYAYQVASTHNIQLGFSIGLILPLIGAFLSFLAFKAIKKDDNLVKSIDRIR